MFLLPEMAPKTPQDRHKTVPRRSSRGTFSTLKDMIDLGPFWDRVWLPVGTYFGHPKGSKNRQKYGFGAKGPREAPRGLQEAPRRHPKGPQEAFKGAPRGPQEAQRGLQEAPKRAQDGPKKAKEGIERAQETSQEGAGGRMSWYLPVVTGY